MPPPMLPIRLGCRLRTRRCGLPTELPPRAHAGAGTAAVDLAEGEGAQARGKVRPRLEPPKRPGRWRPPSKRLDVSRAHGGVGEDVRQPRAEVLEDELTRGQGGDGAGPGAVGTGTSAAAAS